ncbi:MAG: DUF2099 family protein [Kiritimatiellae bacterium]|nr:DUF2099 family protein [Kiritimatiellia bacterium]
MTQTTIERFLARFPEERAAGDLHITRMFGALVAVSGGRVIGVRGPALRHCPLAAMLYDGLRAPEPDEARLHRAIAEAVESKIREFGHFTARREIARNGVAVPYGASEMMMVALRKNALDCAVTVCDCVGTVISADPELVQGIGARMNGLFYTSPVPEVVASFHKRGARVLSPATAAIDQAAGVRAAAESGCRRVAVTVNGSSDESLAALRALEKEMGLEVTVLGVCTTGISRERAETLADHADLIWSCASRHVRDLAAGAILQITSAIPIFVFTERGLRFVGAYGLDSTDLTSLDTGRKYLISGAHRGRKIGIGKMTAYLSEVDSLPIASAKAPRPLTG